MELQENEADAMTQAAANKVFFWACVFLPLNVRVEYPSGF